MIDGKDKARIEAAILELDALSAGSKQRSDMLAGEGSSLAARGELRVAGEWNRLADLGRYFLGQEQDTWKDADFGLETTRSDEGT